MKYLAIGALFGLTVTRAVRRTVDGRCGQPCDLESVAPSNGETHFRAIRQITFGGENAEAYFSHDGSG